MLKKEEVRRLGDELRKAIAGLKIEGYQLVLGRCTYGATAVFKLEACPVAASGEVTTAEADDFKRFASLYGVRPEQLGQEITWGGKRYKITGLATKSRRFPIMATRIPDGARMKLPTDCLKTPQGEHSAFRTNGGIP